MPPSAVRSCPSAIVEQAKICAWVPGAEPKRLIFQKNQCDWPCVGRTVRGAAPLLTHDLVRIARLTIRGRPEFHNLRLYPMGFERNITTLGFIRATCPPLTGGCGFDQCPAPFAGPRPCSS